MLKSKNFVLKNFLEIFCNVESPKDKPDLN